MPKKKNKKPKVGIVGLTSCEGCQFAIMDLGNRFLELFKYLEITQFRLLEEKVFVTPKMDICFVEGSVITKENEKIIKEIRNQSEVLVALGNCASMGGVHQIKNYHQPKKMIQEIYFHSDKIDNPEILDLKEIVEVDYIVPGCPINNLEFLKLVYSLLKGIDFKIFPKPVCDECQTRGYRCVLMSNPLTHSARLAVGQAGSGQAKEKGKICLGPIIQSGCEAVCLKSEMPCQGCRGLYKGAVVENHLKHLEKMGYSKQDINHQLEIYGLRNEVEELLKNNKK